MGSGAAKKKYSYVISETDIERHKEIEKQILNEKNAKGQTFKLLLLGNADSGKSTVVKQMKILHMSGFNDCELVNYRYLVFFNIVEAIEALMNSAELLKIFFDTNTQEKIQKFTTLAKAETDFNASIIKLAADLWETPDFQDCFAQRYKLQLHDNVEHFLTNLERIAVTDYLPNNTDILFCRVHTTGVHWSEFEYKNKFIRLIDVGGQKAERKKWIHVFDDVTAILFVAALSAYDQPLAENPLENRMSDALALFDETCTSAHFKTTSVMLFLNKKDIFEQKIKHIPLTVCFKEYKGKNDYESASAYIKNRFVKPHDCEKRRIYSHQTNATNTENIDKVFKAVVDVVLKKTMRTTAL